jgi:lactate permease
MYKQVLDPVGNSLGLSTIFAVLPLITLFVLLGGLKLKAHVAAMWSLAVALLVAIAVYSMPVGQALDAGAEGAIFGLFPIMFIVINAIWIFNMLERSGHFAVIRRSFGRLSDDQRVQAVLIAFCFGALLEALAGFGTPVAICSVMLIGLGFQPIKAAAVALVANTAPVAFGAIGTPILTLAAVTGIPAMTIGMMAGRQLPFVSLIVPAWLVVTMSGWRGLRSVWPAVLVCGGTFALVQFAWSNYIGVELVDIAGGLASIFALGLFCKVWQPRDTWESADVAAPSTVGTASASADTTVDKPARHAPATQSVARAWMPWVFLSLAVIVWGLAPVKAFLGQGPLAPAWKVPLLHKMVFRDHPVVTTPVDRARISDAAYRNERAEAAVFTVNWASATGSAIFLAAVVSALYLRVSLAQFLAVAVMTLRRMRAPLATIMLMMALGFVTRFGGTDATLGLAFTKTGWLYPFFGTLLGWLGVALTGSDTSSNVLFGSLQKITAQQLGFNPVLIVTANSTGGVMGKMIDAQSIVVATAATGQTGQEGRILRFVFWHSVALAAIMGVIVMLQAYVFPWMIP